jgi:single-stranded DNA-specific DHH superfamily exonuclease
MLTDEQMKEIKEELMSSERPLFFFHDDADGLASFLQFYKQVGIGKGIMVKSTPKVDDRFIKSVENYGPDKIFALDLAIIEQDFVDKINKRIIWIDHHDITDVKGTRYYNPKQNKKGDNTCVSKLSYDILGENFWIAAVGTIGDWQLPEEFRERIMNELPDLFDKSVKTPEKALFETKLGRMAKIFNFVIKGPTEEAKKAVKVLTRINSPEEILEETTEQGKFLMKKFRKIDVEYEKMLSEAIKGVKKEDPLLVFVYEDNKISLTGELSNELLYRYPEKIIIIARHHGGDMKTSFRSHKSIYVRDIVEKAIAGINGRFGGHENACGGQIKDTEWGEFIKNMRKFAKDVL